MSSMSGKTRSKNVQNFHEIDNTCTILKIWRNGEEILMKCQRFHRNLQASGRQLLAIRFGKNSQKLQQSDNDFIKVWCEGVKKVLLLKLQENEIFMNHLSKPSASANEDEMAKKLWCKFQILTVFTNKQDTEEQTETSARSQLYRRHMWCITRDQRYFESGLENFVEIPKFDHIFRTLKSTLRSKALAAC